MQIQFWQPERERERDRLLMGHLDQNDSLDGVAMQQHNKDCVSELC